MDVSPWLRPDAATAPDRSFCHTYGRGEDGHRMIPGRPHSVVAALETGRTSWTAILNAVRLEPGADVAASTAAQLRDVVEKLIAVGHWREGAPEILVVLDAEFPALGSSGDGNGDGRPDLYAVTADRHPLTFDGVTDPKDLGVLR